MTTQALTKATTEEPIGSLVRRKMFAGVQDDDVRIALAMCDRYGLDALLKHVVIIKGQSYITHRGLLHIAHESKQLDGMNTILGRDEDGLYAETTIYRKDANHPFVGRAYLIEYQQVNNTGDALGAWKTHPRSMLIKVAEVFTMRRAFNVSIPPIEEMDAVPDFNAKVVAVDATTGEITPLSEPPKANGKHWSAYGNARARFWMLADRMALSHAEAHEALGVDHLADYPGSMDDAKAALEAYVAAHTDLSVDDGDLDFDEQPELEELRAER